MKPMSTFNLIVPVLPEPQAEKARQMIARDGYEFHSLFQDGSVELMKRGEKQMSDRVVYIDRKGRLEK